MKLLVAVAALGFASLVLADSASDRAAIESAIAALNGPSQPASALFAKGADSAELANLAQLDQMLSPAEEPLSEVTAPKIVVRSIRFVTPDVALVDGAVTQYGAVIFKKTVPILLVMKKQGANWRIAAFRSLVDLPVTAPRAR
jgi:hypothetical protein